MPIKFHRCRRVIAVLLLISLLLSLLVTAVYAQDEALSSVPSPMQTAERPGSESYRLHYTTQLWESATDAGTLLTNDTTGIRLDIHGRGAGLSAVLLPYEGQTHCNALQIVLENRSACTELLLCITHKNRAQVTERTVRLQPHSVSTVYYAYLDDVDLIEQVTLTLQGVSDGEITLYSFSRVSFYQQLSDEQIYGTIQECYYDAVTKNVIIQGRLQSDSVVDFSGGRIALYRLGVTQDASAAANGSLRALQTVKVSNRFTFTLPAETFEERNSRYALVLISADGERVLMNQPCFPCHRPMDEEIQALTPSYKGVCSGMSSFGSATHPDAVIVDVFLDALIAENGTQAESYAYENAYYSFNRAYQNELERQVIPHLQIGRQVYLRISIRANAAGYQLPYTISAPSGDSQPQYLAVCLNSAEAQKAYCAVLQYLMGLFSSQRTEIAGVILGHSMDNSLHYYYAGMIPLQEYLQEVVNTVIHTQNVVKSIFPKANLYLPVSDTKYPSYYSSYDLDGIYATTMLLDGVGRMLEDIGQGNFVFRPLLEMQTLPIVLTQELLQADEDDLGAVVLADMEAALTPQELMRPLYDYKSVGNSCSVLWTAPDALPELPWMLSYIYMYYAMQTEQVDTFFTYLDEKAASAKVCELISRIDTAYAAQVTRFALSHFDMLSFSSLAQHPKAGQSKQLRMAPLAEEARTVYTGRYSYWNFAAAIGTLQWTPGDGCLSLAADGGSRYGRALLAQVRADGQGGEILYRFTNPEDFSLCDALAFTLAVTDQKGNFVPANFYLTLYGENERIEANCALQSGKITTQTLSGLPLASASACTAISIRLEPIGSFDDQMINLYLFNVEGLSRLWDSATLQTYILEQREIRNAVEEEIPSFGVYPMLLLTALTLLTTMGVVLTLRASKSRKQNDQMISRPRK